MKKTITVITICLLSTIAFAQAKDSITLARLQVEANSYMDSLVKNTTVAKFRDWADATLPSKAFRSLDSLLTGIKVLPTVGIEKAMQVAYETAIAMNFDRLAAFYNYYKREMFDKWYAKKNKSL